MMFGGWDGYVIMQKLHNHRSVWKAYMYVLRMYGVSFTAIENRDKKPFLKNIPFVVAPFTISNNLPATDYRFVCPFLQ